ncbi:hypothetical protein ALP64_201454 [Pseudomonas syringae pv. actinidiae]|nr:hypothetical protein ALP64_201454 [Pseudomonas syringae pv. actinidiae]
MSHAEYIMLRNIKVVDLWRMCSGLQSKWRRPAIIAFFDQD